MESLLDVARQYARAGLSVIPVRADGSKAPSIPWKAYSERMPTDEELVKWFGSGQAIGIAVVCGKVSGNLAVLDFETGAAYERWCDLFRHDPALLAPVVTCPTVLTPKGGRHVYCRVSADKSPAGRKLARKLSGETLVEVRGQGNYVLAPGCPPTCHPENKPYQWVNMGWINAHQ